MSEVRPALTPEEWEWAIEKLERYGPYMDHSAVDDVAHVHGCHAAAAVALYNQPFGFTWEDVTYLRWISDTFDWSSADNFERMDDLADRIEALLPPEDMDGKPNT